jgi:hypothetical protein
MCPWAISSIFWWLSAQHIQLSSFVLNEERSAKQREGMFLDLVHWFLCTNIYGLSAGNREKKRRKQMRKSWLSTAKVQLGLAHRTVRWCTGQCPVRQAELRLKGRSRENLAAYGYNSPDCPVVHRIVRWANGRQRNGRPRNPRATRGPRQRSARGTGLSGAPTATALQRSAVPELEGNRAPDMNSGWPVVDRTVRCATRQKARIAFLVGLQRLLAALGL